MGIAERGAWIFLFDRVDHNATSWISQPPSVLVVSSKEVRTDTTLNLSRFCTDGLSSNFQC